jgi:hypothetical protein
MPRLPSCDDAERIHFAGAIAFAESFIRTR